MQERTRWRGTLRARHRGISRKPMRRRVEAHAGRHRQVRHLPENQKSRRSRQRARVPDSGYPTPPNPISLGLSWCPATVGFQVRVFALQAAGAQCAIATGSSSTPEQINARRQEIKAVCDRLTALGVTNCQCPPRLQP